MSKTFIMIVYGSKISYQTIQKWFTYHYDSLDHLKIVQTTKLMNSNDKRNVKLIEYNFRGVKMETKCYEYDFFRKYVLFNNIVLFD